MRSIDLFPDKQERDEVKSIIDMFNGFLTQVLDENGDILFESKYSFDNMALLW